MPEVYLNIYDLYDNSWMYPCGLGIFHSGVVIDGPRPIEYAYGGHEYNVSGIFATDPKDAPGPVQWREACPLGTTALGEQEVHKLVQEMGREYRGSAYHLLERNCNHFADEFSFRLTGKRMPGWINRLAGVAVCLHSWLPTSCRPTWLPPLTIPTADPLPESEEQALLVAGAGSSSQPPRLHRAAMTVGDEPQGR